MLFPHTKYVVSIIIVIVIAFHVKYAGYFWFILYSLACLATLIIPKILIIEVYMDSTLVCIGVIKEQIVSVICSEDLVTVCLFSLRLPQNLVSIVLQLLLLSLVVKIKIAYISFIRYSLRIIQAQG